MKSKRSNLPLVYISLCALILLFTATCEGRNDKTALPQANDSTTTQAELPVNLPVQQPDGQCRSGLQLPSPTEMLSQLNTARLASYTPVDLLQVGSDYQPSLPNANVGSDGTQAVYSPDWDEQDAGLAGLAYACYTFTLEDYDLASGLMLTWSKQPADPADCFVGLGNFYSDRWDWYQCNAQGVISTAGFSPYIENSSKRFLAVVAVMGTAQSTLMSLSVGSGICGTVKDTAGAPIPRVSVKVPGYGTFCTNLNGEFNAWGLDSNDRLAVSFSAEGYVDTTFIYTVAPGANAFAEIRMLPRSAPVTIDADAGGSVPIGGGGSITLPANALVDSTGAALTGTTQGSLTFMDISDDAQLAAAPGDFSAVQLDDSAARLESYGITEIAINDGRGEHAQLASGMTAQVRFPIPAAQQSTAPGTMGLYSFDESTGEWNEEGTLIKDGTGQFYEGEISHFSHWNCDLAYITTCLKAKVVDAQGNPVPGVCIRAQGIDYQGFTIGWTGMDGIACLEAKTGSHVELSLTYRDLESDPVEVETETLVKQCEGDYFECEIKHTFTLEFPPRGLLIASPTQGNPPLTVTFNASGSFDRDGEIKKYEWDYDGSTGGYSWFDSGENPSVQYTYNDKGAYCAAVRLTDDQGHTSISGIDIYSGLNGGNGGDWWMDDHDPQHTSRSAFTGPATANLVWSYEDNYQPITCPIIAADGTIYSGFRFAGLIALNPSDGTEKWNSPEFGVDLYSCPAIGTDGTVYAGFFDWGVRAFSPINGDIKWVYWTGNVVSGGLAVGYNGILYVPSNDCNLHAVDTATGMPIWQRNVGSAIYTTPAIDKDGSIYVIVSNGYLYAYDANGTQRWRSKMYDGVYGGYSASPCIGQDGTVYAYYGAEGKPGIAAFNPASGEMLWRLAMPSGYSCNDSASIGADGTLYVGGNYSDPEPNGSVFAVNHLTGEILWESVSTGGYIHITPTIDAAGRLYITNSGGYVVCLSGTDGSEVWSYDVPSSQATVAPTIGEDGMLFCPMSAGLYAFRDP